MKSIIKPVFTLAETASLDHVCLNEIVEKHHQACLYHRINGVLGYVCWNGIVKSIVKPVFTIAETAFLGCVCLNEIVSASPQDSRQLAELAKIIELR